MDKAIESSLEEMIPYMTTFATGDVRRAGHLSLVSKAAGVKAFEFLLTALGVKETDAFFLLPALRGICEDYIVLKFFTTQLGSDADSGLEKKTFEDLYTSARIQWTFFEKSHPTQKLYYKPEFDSKEVQFRTELSEIITRHGSKPANNYSGLPRTRQMADKSGLLELYEYIYHATSSMVHFSPRILLRMGWGDLPEIKFSTTTFGKYYRDFALFYGSYLFVELFEYLIQEKLVDDSLVGHIGAIKKAIEDKDRWPELVTFEEMNVSSLTKIIRFDSPDSAKEKMQERS